MQFGKNSTELASLSGKARQSCGCNGVYITSAHGPEHRKQAGPPKRIGLSTFAALAYDTVPVAGCPFTEFHQLLFGNAVMSASGACVYDEDIIDKLSDKEQSIQIHKALHNLKDPYKEVFTLRIMGELSFKEIAEIFSKTETWAKVTFYRAKDKLIEMVEDMYED